MGLSRRWRDAIGREVGVEVVSVENPTWVLRGYAGAQVAVLPVSRRQYLHTVYKEISRDDGFIITAFVARDYNRGLIVWP